MVFLILPHNAYFNIIKILVIVLLLSFVFLSCSVSKSSYIFKNISKDTIIQNSVIAHPELTIGIKDQLTISISSLNPAEDILYASSGGAVNFSKESSSNAGAFQVSLDGHIYLHNLGSLKVIGLTRQALKYKLEKELTPYLKDPVVSVSFANHFITVTGVATSPKIINMPTETISIIDALTLSGNASKDATYQNLMVIRDSADAKKFKHLNLEDHSIFNSPWYYLLPADIVVINPDTRKIEKEQNRNRNQLILSSALSVLSIVIIVLDRIF